MDFIFIILINFFLIIILSHFAKKIYLVDIPDNRKLHNTNVPLIGGIAMYLSLLIIFLIFKKIDTTFYHVLIFASGLIVLVGIIDDFKNINYKLRIILIFLICCIVIFFSDIFIRDLGIFFNLIIKNLGFFGILFTLFSVFALVNAFNFMDGVDGLTSVQSIVILTTLIFYNYLFSLNHDLRINIYLIESLAIFLLFNLFLKSKFKIFLGDAGSMFLGFIISWIIIFLSQDSSSLPVVLVPWILSYPIFDLVSTVIIRINKKKSPFKPDHYHFHYILLKKKYMSSTNINLIILTLTIFLNLLGFLSYTYLSEEYTFIIFVISFVFFHYYKWQNVK